MAKKGMLTLPVRSFPMCRVNWHVLCLRCIYSIKVFSIEKPFPISLHGTGPLDIHYIFSHNSDQHFTEHVQSPVCSSLAGSLWVLLSEIYWLKIIIIQDRICKAKLTVVTMVGYIKEFTWVLYILVSPIPSSVICQK